MDIEKGKEFILNLLHRKLELYKLDTNNYKPGQTLDFKDFIITKDEIIYNYMSKSFIFGILFKLQKEGFIKRILGYFKKEGEQLSVFRELTDIDFHESHEWGWIDEPTYFGVNLPDNFEKLYKKEQLKNLDEEESIITKNKKRIYLPHFKRTEWKDITIRFLDELNVHIKGGNKTVISDCESLGFLDEKRKKPNLAWTFLLGIAKNDGETGNIQSPVPDNIKQKKMQISDFFKNLFKNDSDPFYDFSETNTYKLKIKLIPPSYTENNSDNEELGIQEDLKEVGFSKYESDNNDRDW